MLASDNLLRLEMQQVRAGSRHCQEWEGRRIRTFGGNECYSQNTLVPPLWEQSFSTFRELPDRLEGLFYTDCWSHPQSFSYGRFAVSLENLHF